MEETMTGKSILIVEDDEAVRFTLSGLLAKEGWDVIEATDAASALEFFKEEPASVVLVDCRLPGKIDGIELVSKLRSLDKSVPVVVYTGYATAETYFDAQRAGVTQFIAKPCDSEILKKVLRRALDESATA